MSREQNTQPEHDARASWCSERRPGDHTAVFYPGDDLRCPGTKRLSRGATEPCGAWLDGFKPKADSKVVVKALPHRFASTPGAGLLKPCRDCGSALEIFPILEATG